MEAHQGPAPPANDEKEKKGLSGVAIAMIALASVQGLVLVGAQAYFLCLRKNQEVYSDEVTSFKPEHV